MASSGDEENDIVLSDVEAEDDPVAPPSKIPNSSETDAISAEKFWELLAELDHEKQLRIAVENSKSELQVSFNRLKALAHEAIKKRDESARARDEAIREKEEALAVKEKLSSELMEVNGAKDEILRQLDDAVKAKDSSRVEIEAAAQMLVTGIDKISGKVNHIKNFNAGGLPRSQKYTGLPAVAYGVIKRANEIVEEVLKSRDKAREQMEQRNYEIAIEVSQLEATISQLSDEVSEKSSQIDSLKKSIAEKDGKLSEMESGLSERFSVVENERAELRKLVDEYESSIRDLESTMELQRPLLAEQLSFVSRIHDQLYNVIKIIDANNADQSELSESLFLPQETGLEENMRAALAGLESVYELSRIVIAKTRDVVEENSREMKTLNETVARLFREKEHVGVLLRSALSKRSTLGLSSKTSEVFQVAENGLREAGIEFKFGNLLEDAKLSAPPGEEGVLETKDDEIYALAGALENIIKESQLKIIELQHSVEELRAESSLFREHLETQAKELSQKKHHIEMLEEKERQANENIEGLMMDIAAAEEEIIRWKVAAEQEVFAGRAVEQEYLTQISSLKQEVEEAKQAMVESEKKLKFKEETAAAAMAAREAAEKSLRLADTRASRLRDRVEELTHQLENLDNRDNSRSRTRSRYVCWPWEWLGIDFVGYRQTDTPEPPSSNEMELSEPLL